MDAGRFDTGVTFGLALWNAKNEVTSRKGDVIDALALSRRAERRTSERGNRTFDRKHFVKQHRSLNPPVRSRSIPSLSFNSFAPIESTLDDAVKINRKLLLHNYALQAQDDNQTAYPLLILHHALRTMPPGILDVHSGHPSSNPSTDSFRT